MHVGILLGHVCGGQQRVSDFLKLKLQMVGSCYIGSGNQTWVL